MMSVRFNTRKSELGATEFTPLVEALHSPVFDLSTAQINLFGLFQRESDGVELAINLAQEITGEKVGEKVANAILVGVSKMYGEFYEQRSDLLLENLLRKLSKRDFQRYHRADNQHLLDAFEEEIKERPELRIQLELTNDHIHIGDDDIAAATTAANIFKRLHRGEYGNTFGGKNTLYEVLSQDVVALDWERVPAPAQRVLDAVLMRAEGSAIAHRLSEPPKPGEFDPTRIIPHISVSDEEGETMGSLMHARAAAYRANKARAYVTVNYTSLQYNSQVTQAGDAGSELRGLAQQIEYGVGVRFIFRQPHEDEILQRISRLGMADVDVAQLPLLNQGEAVIWVRDRPPLYYKHVVLSTLDPLIKTEGARNSMNNATPVWSMHDFRERAEKAGVVVIGQ
jgi:hypothetical protein